MNRIHRPEPHTEPLARPARHAVRSRPHSSLHSILLAGLAVWLVAACAGSPDTLRLGVTSPGRELEDVAALREVVAAQLDGSGARSRASPGEPAWAVLATQDELIAARLDRSPKDARSWRSPLASPSGPVLAPGLVVVGAERSWVGFATADGRPLWRLPAQDRVLLAATSDAENLALLLVDRHGRRSIAVYEREPKGAPRERLRITSSGMLGTPALLSSTLLVPWGEGYLSAVDVAKRVELGRARPSPAPLHALWWDGALFFGGPPWVELTRGGAPPYSLPRRPLPGSVMGQLPDAAVSSSPNSPTLGPAVGTDVTRLYVQPVSAGSAASGAGEHFMATYGRVAFGFERERGALEWVLALPGRALAAIAIDGRFIVCDDSGGVRLLSSATGRIERFWQIARQRRITLGEPTLAGCALAPGAVLASDPDAAAGEQKPLLEQLAAVLALSDPGLSDAQRFLSRELAARPEPEATRVLIELVRRHSLERVLQSEAEDLLATRRNGEDHMLAALSESGPRGEEALPPIAPLGEALAALGEKRAAPLLARQLNRPAHTASAIARAAAALEQLASEAEYDELSVFFSLHRTSADGPEWNAAVISIGRTLLRVGGQRARTLIQFALRDPLTIPEIKSTMERELTASAPIAGSKADLAN